MLEKKIALLTSVTFNNIGNGFIDLGAEAALMKALPLNAELFKVSSNANFAATMGQMFMLKENPIKIGYGYIPCKGLLKSFMTVHTKR